MSFDKPRPKSGTLRREEAHVAAGFVNPSRPSSVRPTSAVMSLRELSRIKLTAALDYQEKNYKMEKKAMLKKLSQDKINRFPDTLEATRQRKIDFVKRKTEMEEEARREIDRQEAEYQRAARHAILEKAEAVFFSETDSMKLLKSRQTLAVTAYHRGKQIEERKGRGDVEKVEAAKYHEITMSQIAQGNQEEAEKTARRERMIEEVGAARKAQLDEVLATRAKQKEDDVAFGVAMRARVEEMRLDALEKQRLREEMIAQKNLENIKANEVILAQKELLQRQNAEYSERLEAEVAVIDARKQAQKDVAVNARAEKQKARDAIIARAVALLEAQSKRANSIMQRQADEARAKDDAKEAAKEAKREEARRLMDESRNAMLQDKYERYVREAEVDKALLEEAKRANEEGIQREQKKMENRLRETAELKAAQKRDALTETKRRAEARVNKITEERLLIEGMGGYDRRFREKCAGQIEDNIRNGVTVVPLLPLMEMESVRLLPAKRFPEKRRQKGQPR